MPYKNVADERAAARRRYGHNDAIREDLVKRKSEVRDRNRAYVNKIKTEAPCADCGVSYPPYVMQFDHLGEDKDRDITTLTRSPVAGPAHRGDRQVRGCVRKLPCRADA